MTSTLILTAVFMGGVMAVMAIGVMLGGSPLKGSCGGKGGPDCVCDAFEREKCRRRKEAQRAAGVV